jgi:hypothetical protein
MLLKVALSTIKPNQAKPIVDVVTCFQMHYKDDLPIAQVV